MGNHATGIKLNAHAFEQRLIGKVCNGILHNIELFAWYMYNNII